MADKKNVAAAASKYTELQRDVHELTVWDVRMERAAEWLGLRHHPVTYRLISDQTMLDLMAYEMMMPTDYPHWSKGKRAEENRQNAGNFHVFEAALNLNPSIVWLGVTNTMPMQINVMAHAVYGHVTLCTNNYMFDETAPETALNRFAQYREKVQKLLRDPRWGWDGVEYILDAAHSLEHHSGWLPTLPGVPSDEQLRKDLEEQADVLRERIKVEGDVSAAEEKVLRRKLADIEKQLMRHPIKPTNDLLGYLIDPKNTPHLDAEARMLIDIVRDKSRYLQPVGRTKIMHEGWSSYWEEKVLKAPHVGIPFEYAFDLAQSWSMHDGPYATKFYFDPYAHGRRIFEFIDEKYGYDEGEVEIERPVLARDEDGLLYETGETEKVTAVKRNRDKFFEVAYTYEDKRFLSEFLNEEFLQKTNDEALGWCLRFMHRVNQVLKSTGWGPQVIFDPLPYSLEEMMKIVQVWLQEAEMAQQFHQEAGMPLFPAPVQLMQQMAQVIQIVAAYDQDRHMLRNMMVKRAGAQMLPNVYVMDDGRNADGVLTLKHEFDPNWGPLLQSECRDTLKYFRRLYGRPVRLLTMEQRTSRDGEPIGDPQPYEYFIEKDLVKERFL